MASATADNTLVREIQVHGPKPAGPCAMVIFGVTGDLSKRLLLPAVYNLAWHGHNGRYRWSSTVLGDIWSASAISFCLHSTISLACTA